MTDLSPRAQNAQRANWALEAVDVFAAATFGDRNFTDTVREQPDEGDDAYCMIQDLISDALHLAVRHNWSVDRLLERARKNFDFENAPDYQGD